jgi:hypothetical protein
MLLIIHLKWNDPGGIEGIFYKEYAKKSLKNSNVIGGSHSVHYSDSNL